MTLLRPLRCPRCGAQAQALEQDHFDGTWAVVCTAVLCRTIGPRRPTLIAAIEVWNARPAAHQHSPDD